jgi:hypothetical protein
MDNYFNNISYYYYENRYFADSKKINYQILGINIQDHRKN